MTRNVLVIAMVVLSIGGARAADSPAKSVPPAELTQKLENAIDGRLDIDLKSGDSYVRCKLLKVTGGGKDGMPKTLKFQETDDSKPITVGFNGVRSISIDREQIYLAPDSGKKSGKEAMLEREAKAAASLRAKWVARANANGVKPWPELTAAEHKKEEQETRDKIEKIKAAFPGTALYETHEFLFLSDMPRDQVVPFAASLDQMYDMMCQMYGIKKGASVFKGKCMIVAFVQKSDFTRFEKEFQNHVPPDFAQGLCQNGSDGHVLMSCYYGDYPPETFGQLLVHETSHGFIHRYRTPARLPSWANEGMADWLAQTLVTYHGGVSRKREMGREAMQQSHSVQGMFTETQINPVQYGMATDLTDYLIQKDARKYAEWVSSMKEGKAWEASLKDCYGLTPEQLLAEYGQAIGIPDLRP